MINIKSFGLASATLTPFQKNGSIDLALLKDHVDWLLQNGCNYISLFGTTGEGPSVSMLERYKAVAFLADQNFDFSKCVMGLCGTAVNDVIAQIENAQNAGCTTFLLPPPYYYKGVSEDALYEWFSPVLERMTELQCQAVLYHIPQVTRIGLSAKLLSRLNETFPLTAVAVKDSEGAAQTTETFLQIDNVSVLVGDERLLGDACANGAVGSISGLANVIPGELQKMISVARQDPKITALVDEIDNLSVTPALKSILAEKHNDPNWLTCLAPFEPLEAETAKSLVLIYKSLFEADKRKVAV